MDRQSWMLLDYLDYFVLLLPLIVRQFKSNRESLTSTIGRFVTFERSHFVTNHIQLKQR